MPFASRLRNRMTPSPREPRPAGRPAAFRPGLESLDERYVPSFSPAASARPSRSSDR